MSTRWRLPSGRRRSRPPRGLAYRIGYSAEAILCRYARTPNPSQLSQPAQVIQQYFAGTTTLNELAVWLNDQGLRTRNTRKLKNPDGSVTQGPRLFTNASVRVILHNAFYAGLVTGLTDQERGCY